MDLKSLCALSTPQVNTIVTPLETSLANGVPVKKIPKPLVHTGSHIRSTGRRSNLRLQPSDHYILPSTPPPPRLLLQSGSWGSASKFSAFFFLVYPPSEKGSRESLDDLNFGRIISLQQRQSLSLLLKWRDVGVERGHKWGTSQNWDAVGPLVWYDWYEFDYAMNLWKIAFPIYLRLLWNQQQVL